MLAAHAASAGCRSGAAKPRSLGRQREAEREAERERLSLTPHALDTTVNVVVT
jgi:hypothetical protein